MILTKKQVKNALKSEGASFDFSTGKLTKKRGFLVSIKDTESQIKNATLYNIEDLTSVINKILTLSTYNEELNKKNLLGLWIDKEGTLFIDVSKCLKVTNTDIYKVKNEAIINNQYAIFNNETYKTYNLILPVYTLYKTKELLTTPDSINNYSMDFYNTKDIANYFHSTKANISPLIFDSIDDIPTDYNNTFVIIKDLSNFTRDIMDEVLDISIDYIFKYSKLIEA